MSVQEKSAKEVRSIGKQVIALSGIALLASLTVLANTTPPMGGLGRFTHAFALIIVLSSALGLATGIGLMRGQRWAWVSMLVFGGIVVAAGALLGVPFLLMPVAGVVWWEVLTTKAIGALFFVAAAVIGGRWFAFFRRADVKAYFDT